ncbi:MAG: hypothetical protein AVDCRST_MAG10-2629 [uncultured Acidimicrobiales bacterium]|uniref:Uncharacterized protein n=1 Tax=uncultured Acidimicrobiales bacterium TaxID=310071 RepID=A0A6J4ISP4_9ACTN|nr:MAG: hypothetical protein AVDCRST_MAG10-2629 [uncultured Acidimicrobiales bacterium]
MPPLSGIGETEARMVAGPLLLGIGIGLLMSQLLAGALIGLGAGITLRSVVSALGTRVPVRGRRS